MNTYGPAPLVPGHVADRRLHLERRVVNRVARDARGACGWRENRGEDPNRCRLAGPVRAQETEIDPFGTWKETPSRSLDAALPPGKYILVSPSASIMARPGTSRRCYKCHRGHSQEGATRVAFDRAVGPRRVLVDEREVLGFEDVCLSCSSNMRASTSVVRRRNMLSRVPRLPARRLSRSQLDWRSGLW